MFDMNRFMYIYIYIYIYWFDHTYTANLFGIFAHERISNCVCYVSTNIHLHLYLQVILVWTEYIC